MSNAQEHHTEEHQALIKTPRQLITVVVLAFVVPIIIIIMLVNFVANQTSTGAGSDAMSSAAIDARVAPVAGFELVDASAPREFLTGQAVYEQVCAACHTAGVAGAPATGDESAWAPRLDTGYDALVASTIDGKGAMPPKGGASNLSDFEIERAVVYLANQAGANFDEPQEPAAEGEAAEGEAASQATQDSEPVAEQAVDVVQRDIHQSDVDAAAEAEAATPEGSAEAAPSGDASIPEAQQQADDPAMAEEAVQAEESASQQDAADGQIVISEDAQTVGKNLYESVCMACHAAGVAGAPKTGNSADWAPYIADGMDHMLEVSIKGQGAMPPRGGAANATDDQLRAAIEYMIADAL